MTATLPARTHTNGSAPRRPVLLEIPRSELVGSVMDWQCLAIAAIEANGASLPTVLRLPAGPWRDEMSIAHHATHDRLVALLAELRMAAGRYDGRPPGA